MAKSLFKVDLLKEKTLQPLLDTCYNRRLKQYNFKRVDDLKQQKQGVDLLFIHKESGKNYVIDEKAQLDYIGFDLPTFAFELFYKKSEKDMLGWLFDPNKKTHFYSLVTAIYADAPKTFTSCKITLVNRQRLVAFLTERGYSLERLKTLRKNHLNTDGKILASGLDEMNEGYFYHSKKNKTESPFNLILRLDFLMEHGLGKQLI